MKLRLTIIALLTLCATLSAQERIDYTEWVDPFIGTADYSATHPGAVVPHGMMAVVPFNVTGSELNRFDKDNRWWSTPYDIRNKYSVGFAHGALSGVGCPELGAIITMATTGAPEADRTKRGSTYSNEVATPGYYATTFDQFAVRAEATATERASVERYTFAEGGEALALFQIYIGYCLQALMIGIILIKNSNGIASDALCCSKSYNRILKNAYFIC